MSKIAYKKAKPPFDHDHSADIIIRTSDNVEFQVHKLILAKSSFVFDNILSLPHLPPEYAAAEDYTDGIAVICLTESSDTIDIFLRCCYPVFVPRLSTANMPSLLPLFYAGKKYEVDVVIQYAATSLRNFCAEKDVCIQAYIIACHLGHHAECHIAAITSLSFTTNDITRILFKNLALVSAATYFELVDFHQRCRTQLRRDLCSPLYWVNRSYHPGPMFALDDRPNSCCAETSETFNGLCLKPPPSGVPGVQIVGGLYRAKQWAVDYLAELARMLDDERISLRNVFCDPDAASRAIQKASECPSCRENAARAVIVFTQNAEEAFDEVVSLVALKQNS